MWGRGGMRGGKGGTHRNCWNIPGYRVQGAEACQCTVGVRERCIQVVHVLGTYQVHEVGTG